MGSGQMRRIKIAVDFSRTPGPRRRKEGKHSGEQFREEILAPAVKAALKANEVLVVDLDDTAGYGTSFLEEAFGGLIRNDGLPLASVNSVLQIVSHQEPDLLVEVSEYLSEAEAESGRGSR